MTRVLLLFTSVITLLLVTCKGEDYTRELSEIDSLRKVLNTTDSLLVSFNSSDITKRAQDIADNSKFIQFNVNKLGDTLDYGTALLLAEYGRAGERFRQANEEMIRIANAIDSMEVNLDNLKHDLENHSLSENVDGKASVIHETSQVNVIYTAAETLKSSLNNTRRSYDTLLPKVNSYVQWMTTRTSAQIP